MSRATAFSGALVMLTTLLVACRDPAEPPADNPPYGRRLTATWTTAAEVAVRLHVEYQEYDVDPNDPFAGRFVNPGWITYTAHYADARMQRADKIREERVVLGPR